MRKYLLLLCLVLVVVILVLWRRKAADISQPRVDSQKSTVLWNATEDLQEYAKRIGIRSSDSVDLGDGAIIDFVLIPAGEFLMGPGGDPNDTFVVQEGKKTIRFWLDELPSHRVTLTRPFFMSKYEITQQQFRTIMGTNPSAFPGDLRPVEQVSWDEANEFCKRLGERVHREFHLPTEAEWEYACRGGTTARFYNGDSVEDLVQAAWYRGNSNVGVVYADSANTTRKVGQKAPNKFGLYDMLGNASEWCLDYYEPDYYKSSPPVDPPGPISGVNHVVRGGDWESNPSSCRSSARVEGNLRTMNPNWNVGFRVICVDVDHGSNGR